MESIDQDCDHFMEHTPNGQLISPSSPDISDIVGDPQFDPRLGHEYQVEIPPMIKESELLQLLADSELVHDEVEDKRNEGLEFLGYNDGTMDATVPASVANVEKNGISENGKILRSTIFQSVMIGAQLCKSKNSITAPDTLSNSWSDADVKSFLLGLFIFGKNFVQIEKFLENKGMGEILSFYYGKFYKSDEYSRWSDCKKIKGRKGTTGHKLFSGRKQHELLSRLIPHVSEEFQDTLLQASKSYVEGRTSLEEYVSSLKSVVGLAVLVEAVGIGKGGKEDLTSISVKPRKKNQVFSIPTRKAWSSLGPNDIMNFLTGGYRMSKAKSNDLFWEAVWPRLLVRGWHTEKLNNQGCVSSKSFMVFLIPGVKKFSKGKLVKGDHYFDSVSDVLTKVIAEPNLLELDDEEVKVSSCNDERAENGFNEDKQSDYHRDCYLKPKASTNNSKHTKNTVIDANSAGGGKSSDSRELKSLPSNSVGKIKVDAYGGTYKKGEKHTNKTNDKKVKLDSFKSLTMLTVVDTSLYEGKLATVREFGYPPAKLEDTSKMSGMPRESDRSFSDDNPPSKTETAMLTYGRKNRNSANFRKVPRDKDATSQKESSDNQDDTANKMTEKGENQKKTIKHQFSRRARSGNSNLAAPPIKRRRLTACVKSETNRILEKSSGHSESEKLKLSKSSYHLDSNKNAGDQVPVSHQQDVSLVLFSAEGRGKENNEGSILNSFCVDKGISDDDVKKCEPQLPINFDAPQVPLKSDKDEKGLKPNDTIPRRHSTRNRPLTVRALESLANEFFHVQRKQKKKRQSDM